MSAQEQQKFFETLLYNISTGKELKLNENEKSAFEAFRRDISDIKCHVFFASRKAMLKGFSDHLDAEDKKVGTIKKRIILAKMEAPILRFIIRVKGDIRRIVAKK